MLRAEQDYPSDLSDQQWDLIKAWIPTARTGGRPRNTDVRQVVNAIFYLNRTGCAWRYLPKSFPPWRTVYGYFIQWMVSGAWTTLHEILNSKTRVMASKNESPSVLIIDSQSTKAHYGEHRGYDGYKKVRGRKRHILVDTLGLIHALRIGPADNSDREEGTHLLLVNFKPKRKLENLYADAGYSGSFEDRVYGRFEFWPIITKRNQGNTKIEKRTSQPENNLKPYRWIVERTFAWFNHFKRLSRDYEKKSQVSETMIQTAMMQLMLKRLIS
jgi:putative transposase